MTIQAIVATVVGSPFTFNVLIYSHHTTHPNNTNSTNSALKQVDCPTSVQEQKRVKGEQRTHTSSKFCGLFVGQD
jgi:hypothetical protein